MRYFTFFVLHCLKSDVYFTQRAHPHPDSPHRKTSIAPCSWWLLDWASQLWTINVSQKDIGNCRGLQSRKSLTMSYSTMSEQCLHFHCPNFVFHAPSVVKMKADLRSRCLNAVSRLVSFEECWDSPKYCHCPFYSAPLYPGLLYARHHS